MKERLLAYRKKYGLSQVELAKLCGISPTTIVRIENGGKPSLIVEGKINKIIGEE
jgi:DNA-binding XRE family transcriptional regulator